MCPEGWKVIQQCDADTNPAKAAYWDGKMAGPDQCELRAAAVFDPMVDFTRSCMTLGRSDLG